MQLVTCLNNFCQPNLPKTRRVTLQRLFLQSEVNSLTFVILRLMQFFTKATLFTILFLCSFQFSQAQQIDFALESIPHMDLLTVDSRSQRFQTTISAEESLLTLCQLKVGEKYSMQIRTEDFSLPCQFDFIPTSGEKENFKTVERSMDQPILKYWTATESCMELRVSNLNCNPDAAYPLWVSLQCESCEKAPSNNPLTESMVPISVSGGLSAQQLVEDIFIAGGCFEVTSVQPIGAGGGRGSFSNGSTSIGVDNGVILSSGNITNALGPNTGGGTGNSFNDSSGDPDLNLLGAGSINDAVGIEFIVEPTVDQIFFQYAFASEEYCEYVGSQFNDVFGFFISGLGISGGFTNDGENIAVVPGSGEFVAINTVNHISNTAYFNGNSTASCGPNPVAPLDIEYDGFTTVLTAIANVVPCRQYNIRLVVADAGDHIFDSAVFLAANSFEAGGDASLTINIPYNDANGAAFEGCSSGEFIFERLGTDLSEDIILPITIHPASTATEGVDFSNLPDFVIIPAGQTSVTLPFDIFDDGILEGLETLSLYIENTCECGGSIVGFNINDAVPLDVQLFDAIFCGPEEGVTISPFITGGAPEYIYQWSTGEDTESITVDINQTTSYSVTISDFCGEEISAVGNFQVNQPSTAILASSGVICADGSGQPILLQVDFIGEGPWNIWYSVNGVTQPPIENITQNPYFIPVTDPGNYQLNSIMSQGCSGSVSGLAIVNTTAIEATPFIGNILCHGNNDGFIDVVASGGTPPHNYQWDYFSTGGSSLFGIGPGDYTLTITDFIGCTAVETYTITSPDELTANLSIGQTPTCEDPNGGIINLDITGGTEFYQILWEDGTFNNSLTGVGPGTYSVTVIDINFCSTEASIDLEDVIDLPTAVAEVSGEISCSQTTSTLSGANSSGTGTLTFEWLNPAGDPISNLESIDVIESGTYTLVVTNEDGCSAETTIDVAEDTTEPSPNAIVSGQLTCQTGNVMLDGSGSTGSGTISYQWFDPNNNSFSTAPNPNATTPGTYTLVITDSANGCTASTTVTVAQDADLPVADIQSVGELTCNAGNVTLDASGSTGGSNLIFEWFDSGSTSLGTNPTIDVTNPDSYTLVVTNTDNGCSTTVIFAVPQNIELPTPDAQVSGQITCIDGNATLDGSNSSATGTIAYEWLDGATSIGTSPTVNVNTPGTYTLIITDLENGCMATTTVDVIQNIIEPVPSATAQGEITCINTEVSLQGSGTSANGTPDLEWFNGNTSLGNGNTIDVIAAGTYTLVVTDPVNGCTASTTVTVTESLTPPTADAGTGAILSCGVTSVGLSGSGSGNGTISYEWWNPSNVSVGANPDLQATQAGTYTLIITDGSNGCTAEDQVTITLDENVPVIDITPPQVLTCNILNIDLDASGSTGTGSLDYLWSTGANSPTITVTTSGVFSLTVTDASNGCTAETTIAVDQNINEPTAVANASGLITCIDGNVTLEGGNSSGEGNLTYTWMNGNTTIGSGENIQVNQSGNYTLVITDDANGCTAETSVQVDENLELPIPIAQVSGMITCTVTEVDLNAGNSSGNGNLTYSWIPPSGSPLPTDELINVTISGTYTLIVTNEINGCTASTTIDVLEDITPPVADAGSGGILSCDVTSVSLDGTGSSNGPNISYQWLNPSSVVIGTGVNVDVTQAGTYTLVVTNTDNGCIQAATVNVTPDVNLPIAVIEAPGTITCVDVDVQLDASGSSSTGTLTYSWLNGNTEIGTNTIISVSQPGVYTLIITDQDNGCTAESTVEVLQDETLPQVDLMALGILTCSQTSTFLELNNVGGGTLSLIWRDPSNNTIGTSPIVQATEAGTYTVTVTNLDNGCTAMEQVEVLEDLTPPIPNASVSAELNCNTAAVDINGNGSTGAGNLTYEWLFEGNTMTETTPVISVGASGTYTLVVTDDANGCTASTDVLVTEDFVPPVADAGDDGILTCDATEIILNGNASSGGNNFTYQWLDENTMEVSTSVSVPVTTPGTYTLIVTNSNNGCTAADQVTIVPDTDLPIPIANVLNVINCNLATATIDGSNSTGTGNLIYEWRDDIGNTLGTDPTLEVDASGNYTLIVTDELNGCSSEINAVVVDDFDAPVADAGVVQNLLVK